MRQPGQPVEVLQNGVTVANRAIAQQEAAEINREDPAAVQRSGDGKNQNAAAQGKQRVEPRRQRYPVDRLLKQVTPGQAERNPRPNCCRICRTNIQLKPVSCCWIISISVMVRNTAIGSLLPDSISSVDPTRSFNPLPPAGKTPPPRRLSRQSRQSVNLPSDRDGTATPPSCRSDRR